VTNSGDFPPATVLVGPWILGESIGGGVSGQVFVASHRFSGKEAAVKVLRQDRTRRLQDGVRFLREGRLLSELEHPSIPHLLDMGVAEQNRMFLALQRFPGRDLRTILQGLGDREPELRRRIRDEVFVPAWRDAVSALAHAHDRGVAHGDVTPSNILVDGRGGPAGLVDWGLARRFTADAAEDADLEETKGAVRVHGTPGYVAPEMLGSERVEPNPLTDIYSLGAVLYHLIAFRPAITAATVPGRLAAALTPPPDPREAAPEMEIPDALADLALHAMRVDPDERPQLADDLLTVLDA